MQSIEEIRELFPITKNKVFLNHAARSPLPKPVVEAVQKYLFELSNSGEASFDSSDYGKALFAKLIGAKPNEIALTESTSVGLNIVANMLKYPHGSKIVTTDLEYPSVVYPWLRKHLGAKLHYVKSVEGKIPLGDVEKSVDDKTVAIVVGHVKYFTGFREDLKALSEIAHEHGAFLIVDAVQSVGAIRLDVKKDDVDFLVTACYKWLLSPQGAAYLYVKEQLIEKCEPLFLGWASVKRGFGDIGSLKFHETASRFEIGARSLLSFAGATEALKIFLNFGMESVERRILALTDYLVENIKALGLKLQTPEENHCRSGIVNFKTDNPEKVVEMLRQRGIFVSSRTQGITISPTFSHGVIVSPHFYNTEEEIDRLIQEVKTAVLESKK